MCPLFLIKIKKKYLNSFFLLFRLTTVEVIRQQEGNNSTLRVQVAAIQCDECGAIPWDELQVSVKVKTVSFVFVLGFIFYFCDYQT